MDSRTDSDSPGHVNMALVRACVNLLTTSEEKIGWRPNLLSDYRGFSAVLIFKCKKQSDTFPFRSRQNVSAHPEAPENNRLARRHPVQQVFPQTQALTEEQAAKTS